jgi:hypothetical protein
VEFHGRAPLLELIVQHGAVLVERDDRVVRQLLLAQPAGLHELERDLEFAAARAEGAFRGQVAARAEHVGLAQAGELVRSLRGARVVELRQQVLRVDGRRTPADELGKGRADECRTRQVIGQRGARRLAAGDAHDLE